MLVTTSNPDDHVALVLIASGPPWPGLRRRL